MFDSGADVEVIEYEGYMPVKVYLPTRLQLLK